MLPAHLILLGKRDRCLVRTESKAWLSRANSLNSASPLGLGKTLRAMRCSRGPTLLFRLEVGVLASGLVVG